MIFNEDKLQAEIIKTWGEFGVHNEVFQAMRKKITDKEQLTLTDVSQQRELLKALADNFNESTHTYVGQPMIEETLKAFNCG